MNATSDQILSALLAAVIPVVVSALAILQKKFEDKAKGGGTGATSSTASTPTAKADG